MQIAQTDKTYAAQLTSDKRIKENWAHLTPAHLTTVKMSAAQIVPNERSTAHSAHLKTDGTNEAHIAQTDKTDATQPTVEERSAEHSAHLTSAHFASAHFTLAHLANEEADAAHTKTKLMDEVLRAKVNTDSAYSRTSTMHGEPSAEPLQTARTRHSKQRTPCTRPPTRQTAHN